MGRARPHSVRARSLPEPNGNFEWRVESDFKPGDAILKEPRLKPIFEQAIKDGCTVVTCAPQILAAEPKLISMREQRLYAQRIGAGGAVLVRTPRR